MKTKCDMWQETSDVMRTTARGLNARHPSPAARHAEHGIALVITLILLSVTLIMAVAFLAVARRERNAVTTTTDTATARLAADTALAAAQAQIAATVLATTNLAAYDYHLLVSTNYINGNGYDPNGGPSGYGPAYPTNVNYDYLVSGGSLGAGQLEQNIANLYLLPRAPVFVRNRNTGSNDFRFYLDLNRNGQFETNNPAYTTPGDPEWVGVLEHPGQPHGPNNKFVARYAFLAQPIGNSLDLNSIHNESFLEAVNPAANGNDSFFRNQSVGSWELNLGAFLGDLNTNQWNNSLTQPYQYNEPAFANRGYAFEDALSLVSYRYANNYNNLANLGAMSVNAGALQNQQIDVFPLGPLMTNTGSVFYVNNTNNYWAGSDNPNHFFSLPSDLFGASQSLGNFPGHLQNISQAYDLTTTDPTNNYNRYTFYRLLDQLGTDSAADDDTRMNVNYRNVTNGVVVPGLETNCFAWTPLEFFTNAANRLLTNSTARWRTQNFGYYTNTFGASTTAAFGVGRIPVYVNGQFVYTPTVNRLLQLAANMYDATTNDFYPHVFRPTFTVVFTNNFRNVYIDGYQEVSSLNSFAIGTPPLDAPLDIFDTALVTDAAVNAANANIYGVPWIIGAKKGLPAFNQFYMRNAVQVTRKLQVTRTVATTPGATATNQMFIMSISNQLGFAFWNSYNTNYIGSGNLTLYFSDIIGMTLTNGASPFTWTSFYGNPAVVQFAYTNKITSWPGSAWTTSTDLEENRKAAPESFFAGVFDFPFLAESVFRAGGNTFQLSTSNALSSWETGYATVPVFPQFGLMTTNRVQAFILDGNHIIDYVQLGGPNGARDLNAEIKDPDTTGNSALMWVTNAFGNNTVANTPTWGVQNQLTISQNGPSGTTLNLWKAPPNIPAIALGNYTLPNLEAAFFKGFFYSSYVFNAKKYTNSELVVQAPYTPNRMFWEYTLWQANDPLVHYLTSDLKTPTNNMTLNKSDDLINSGDWPKPSLNTESERYQPWGRNQQMAKISENLVDTNAYNLRFRDPLVWRSDYWDFPTGKLPGIGWLGRVHRGTPWQTVYLKQRDVLAEPVNALNGISLGTNTWAQWTGNTQNNFDAANSAPVADRDLFDLFTATPNANATRGTLSVNQTHLAAWSAVFSGLVTLTNATDANVTPLTSLSVPVVNYLIIPPAGVDAANSGVGIILNSTNSLNLGINAVRATFTNADGLVGAFERVGDILNVPAYTEKSPFLNHSDDAHTAYDISDELYEWLPQQTLGLLRAGGSPRYVVYCYGQTLRPAAGGIVTDSGRYFGLCTNYQVTAESAARAVIRVEKHVANGGTNYSAVIESFNGLPPN